MAPEHLKCELRYALNVKYLPDTEDMGKKDNVKISSLTSY